MVLRTSVISLLQVIFTIVSRLAILSMIFFIASYMMISISYAQENGQVTASMVFDESGSDESKNSSFTQLSTSTTDEVNQRQRKEERRYQNYENIEDQPDTLISFIQQEIKKQSSNTNSDADNKVNHASELLVTNELSGDFNEAYYSIEALNQGLPTLQTPANLQTPLATLEFLHTATMQKNFDLAAHALNLNGIPPAEQVNYASELVKKLDYLLTEKGLYLFDDMPDRSDGLIEPPVGSQNPLKGVPRRSIKLGYIDYHSRKVPIFLERVRVKEEAPVWVFSKQSVINIETLYDMHKPAEFERYLPSWLTVKIFGVSVWEYITLLLFILLTLGVGWLFSKGVEKLVNWYTQYKQDDDAEDMSLSLKARGLTDLFSKITVPLTITISFSLVFALVSGGIPKVDTIATATRPVIWVGLVFSFLWLGIRIINFFANRYQDFQIDSLDEEHFNKERKRRTYLSIFRRVFIFAMILGGIWISLAEFTDLEGLGTTLLTSAGIAGAVIGIAAQPTLGNIISGIQVALTQPIRIGDTVMLEGIWCEVEDLRYTYAVLKTWDDRRLIVPMKHFVTENLENWSHTNTEQASAVYIYVDYGADIDKIRQKFIDLVKNHKLWNEEIEPQLLTTSVTEDSIKLRGKLGSDSPQHAWEMECEVREQLLTYIAKEQGKYIPTERMTLTSRPD